MENVKLNDQYVNIPLTFNAYCVGEYSSLGDPARAVLNELQSVASLFSYKQKKGDIQVPAGRVTVTLERFRKNAKLTTSKISKALAELQEKNILQKNKQGHFVLANKEVV